jgi:hypothetical protein
MIVLAVVFAGVDLLLPADWGPYVLYLIYPIGSFVTFVAFAFAWQARTKRAA